MALIWIYPDGEEMTLSSKVPSTYDIIYINSNHICSKFQHLQGIKPQIYQTKKGMSIQESTFNGDEQRDHVHAHQAASTSERPEYPTSKSQ